MRKWPFVVGGCALLALFGLIVTGSIGFYLLQRYRVTHSSSEPTRPGMDAGSASDEGSGTAAGGAENGLPAGGAAPASGNCPAVSGPLTEQIVSSYINSEEQGAVNGSSSAPQSVQLRFDAIEIGSTQTAGNDQYANRIRCGTYVPVTVRYTRLEQRGGTTNSVPVGYQYWFYPDESGSWSAVGLGPTS